MSKRKSELEKLLELPLQADADVSDEEFLKLYDQFSALSPEEQAKFQIGEGAYKKSYALPDSPYVIKKGKPRQISRFEEGKLITELENDMDILPEDYLSHKVTGKELNTKKALLKGKKPLEGGIIEYPKLVVRPTQEPLLIQKKLLQDQDWANTAQLINELRDRYDEEYLPRDIRSPNVGLDPNTKVPRLLDLAKSVKSWDEVKHHLYALQDYIRKSKVPLVLRSASPVLKTAGKVGLPLAGAYSSFAEAKDAGLSDAEAAAYTAAEEINPLPISGMELYKGMEAAGEGRRKKQEESFKKIRELVK